MIATADAEEIEEENATDYDYDTMLRITISIQKIISI